jgi:glutamate-1-semialdehyde 2,1-aminomutase
MRLRARPMRLHALPSARARTLQRRAHELIPGGCHTYAKGDHQFPDNAPPLMVRGSGCHAWDVDGRRFIEYGMGLRAVTLGHAFKPVVDAVRRELDHGVNFTRPSTLEAQCAEVFLDIVQSAEMVKFCKDGSHAVDGALRLARAATGRDTVAVCGDHPFFSTSDWFIATTGMAAGIPPAAQPPVLRFAYNDLAALEALFDGHPGRIACVLMEPARTEEPKPGYLQAVQRLAHRHGALLVFDEMITGFRWHRRGAQHLYGVVPDLSTFGKALANGFSVSALAGRREFMELGGIEAGREGVFLLSTTHGAQTHELAAAMATMRFYDRHPVIERLDALGARLRAGFDRAADEARVRHHLVLMSRNANLLFATRDGEGRASQAYRTLFMQELVRRGVMAPSFVVSWSHTEADIDHTVQAIGESMLIYRQALEHGAEGLLTSRPVRPVFQPSGRSGALRPIGDARTQQAANSAGNAAVDDQHRQPEQQHAGEPERHDA